ncbi:MAG TPA: SDR family oxidoreductase [Thermoplasmata archaeon]|nr:SDR family oxidoreductase [Thermoplasmata archaeon]
MSLPSERVALVTGCSSGIGRATALLLARSGYRAFATVRTSHAEESLRREAAGLPLEILQMDLAEEAAAARLVSEVLRRAGRVDVLVNNAGYALLGAVEDLRADVVRRQFQVNVFTPVQLCRGVLPTMRAQRFGRIVNVSSMAGRVSVPLMGAYCASKFALEAFTDSVRAEAKPFGVRVALVEPGPVATEFNRAALAESREILEAASPYRPVYQEYQEDFSTPGAATPAQVARTILKAVQAAHPRSRYRVRAREAFLAGLVQLIPKGAMDFATTRFMGLQKLGRS